MVHVYFVFSQNICALGFKINGPDLNSTQLVVSRHQSAWETIFFLLMLIGQYLF